MPKLQHFSLKTDVLNDPEFAYLKWLLNNLNYVKKLQLHLKNSSIYRSDQIIWQSRIDAKFIRRYCLPDIIHNLIDFDFYITSSCQLSSEDVENIIHSFQTESFFVNRQWTSVKCFYDPNSSYQHLFSSKNNLIQQFDGLW